MTEMKAGLMKSDHGVTWPRTPTWFTKQLLEVETFRNPIWEPACGDGAISEALKESGYQVVSTDLIDYGYGIPGHDFFTSSLLCRAIVTTPPYHLVGQFLERAFEIPYVGMIAFFLKLDFFVGHHEMWKTYPPNRVWIFSERPEVDPFQPDLMYGWFVWEPGQPTKTHLAWIRGVSFSTNNDEKRPSSV